jgi:F-type H+-transporting ATPase subunit gamma
VAGSGLVGIKRRIKSIMNTKKITKAMGLVATAKLRKTKVALEVNKLYDDSLDAIISEIIKNDEADNVYISGNGSNKKLFIILTSDSGMCGSFNLNILNKAIEEISKDKENSVVMVLGEKGAAYFRRINYEAAIRFVGIRDLPTLGEANHYAMPVLHMYDEGEVGEINVIYSKFESQSKQEVTVQRLLPLKKEAGRDNQNENMVFEPKVDNLLDEIIPLYMRQSMLNSLLHSKTSEQSTRMTAMDGATKNANQLLDKLNLKYNRMRQSAITQEISEIVGGAEAQK